LTHTKVTISLLSIVFFSFIFLDVLVIGYLYKKYQKTNSYMASYTINVNGISRQVEADADTPLLWVLRDNLEMVGTKFGCGIAQCGACTVLVNGNAVRSCSLPIASATNGEVTTIEGLSENGDHPLQKAWIEHDVPQCGYCQAGQIMNAASLLNKNPNPSDDEISSAMNGNICRCGTYIRIKAAIKTAAKDNS
jgi:isoquinoline 1-oxidoreductase alpha subunit